MTSFFLKYTRHGHDALFLLMTSFEKIFTVKAKAAYYTNEHMESAKCSVDCCPTRCFINERKKTVKKVDDKLLVL